MRKRSESEILSSEISSELSKISPRILEGLSVLRLSERRRQDRAYPHVEHGVGQVGGKFMSIALALPRVSNKRKERHPSRSGMTPDPQKPCSGILQSLRSPFPLPRLHTCQVSRIVPKVNPVERQSRGRLRPLRHIRGTGGTGAGACAPRPADTSVAQANAKRFGVRNAVPLWPCQALSPLENLASTARLRGCVFTRAAKTGKRTSTRRLKTEHGDECLGELPDGWEFRMAKPMRRTR